MVSRSYKNKKPCKRWFYGYREFEIHTALPVQRVLEKLSDNVAQKSQLFKLKEKPFLGSVESKEFVIRRNNVYKQRVYGNIVREGEGSKLVFTMREDLGVFITISLTLVVWDLFFLSKNRSSLIQGLPFYVPVLLGLRIFFYLLFRFDAACTRIKLLRIFE